MKTTKVIRHIRRTRKGKVPVRRHSRKLKNRGALPTQVGDYKVKYVEPNVLKDYAGMNAYAAKDIGFPKMDKNTILIDKEMKVKDKLETLNHELHEVEHMKQGKSYWEAHQIALKKEKSLDKLRNFGAHEPKGVYDTYQIKPQGAPKGKKTKILEEIEDVRHNLTFPDISHDRRSELEQKLDTLEQAAKRITGRPPIGVVYGKNVTQLETGLALRYAHTSSKKPEFVRALNLPDSIHTPYDRMVNQLKSKEQRERSREAVNIKRLFDRLEEKSIKSALSKRPLPMLKLKDIERGTRGKKLKYRYTETNRGARPKKIRYDNWRLQYKELEEGDSNGAGM